MKVKINGVICDPSIARKHKRYTRVTEEQLNPRVKLIKTELPCHPKNHPDLWFNHVTVQKFIDDNLVKTYSWVQSINQEEKNEFLALYTPKKETKQPKEIQQTTKDRKEYMKAYYLANREKLKEKYKEKCRKYYLEHREECKEKRRIYYLEHREERLIKMKQYYKKKKPCQDLPNENSSEEHS